MIILIKHDVIECFAQLNDDVDEALDTLELDDSFSLDVILVADIFW